MRLSICFLVLLLAVNSVIAEYEGYEIYQTIPQNEDELNVLFNWIDKYPGLDFLTEPRMVKGPVRVVLPPNSTTIMEFLTQNNISFNLTDPDLSKTIKQQMSLTPRSCCFGSGQIHFQKYYRYKDINKYLDYLTRDPTYKHLIKVTIVGYSYENRPLKTIQISSDFSADKDVIFIDAGIHAREWIAPSTALYVIHQLVEDYETNKELLKHYDWVILPVVNPDGYEYSHTTKRMWRKTRSRTTKLKCFGVDGNRNFNVNWSDGIGSDQCSDLYPGAKPFSESETKVVRKLLHQWKTQCKMYLTLHSYGRFFLLPWSYRSELTEKYNTMFKVAKAGYDAIEKKTMKTYIIGSPPRVLKKITGTSMDYAYGVAKIPVTITMELAPGGTGFDPPKRKIRDIVHESWIGIEAMAKQLVTIFVEQKIRPQKKSTYKD